MNFSREKMFEAATDLAKLLGYDIAPFDSVAGSAGCVRFCETRLQVQILGPAYTITSPSTGDLDAVGVSFIVTLHPDGTVHGNPPGYLVRAMQYYLHCGFLPSLSKFSTR